MKEILEKQTIETLIILSRELNEKFIPMNATVRKIVAEIFSVSPEETTYLQMVAIAPCLAMILGNKLETLTKK